MSLLLSPMILVYCINLVLKVNRYFSSFHRFTNAHIKAKDKGKMGAT